MKTIFFTSQKMRYKLFLTILFLLWCSVKSFAQVPPNIGFENGDLLGWETLISGDPTNCPLGNPGTAPGTSNCNLPPSLGNSFDPVNTCIFMGTNTQIFTNGRVTVTPSNYVPSIDPYSGLPVVCPNFSLTNAHSLKLGDDLINDSAETVRTQFDVTARVSLTYWYAAVLQNVGHDYCTQPRLEFNILDLGPINNPYPQPRMDTCASIFFSTPRFSYQLPLNWHVSPATTAFDTIFYSDWTPITINLVRLLNHRVQVSFSTADCAAGGHYGYTYLDIDVNPFKIVNKYCPGDKVGVLFAPKGYQNYVWDTLGNTGTSLAVGQDSLIIYNPRDSLVYIVEVFPSSSACSVKLYDTLLNKNPTAIFTTQPNPACVGYPVDFIDTSYAGYKFAHVVWWNWDFGDTVTHIFNHSGLRFPSHIYNKAGTYYAHLTVKTDFQCISNEKVNPVIVGQPNIVLLDSIHPCFKSSYHLGFYEDSTILGAHWFMKKNWGNLSCSDCLDPTFETDSAMYVYVFFTDKHGCTNTDSIFVRFIDCAEIVVPSAFTPNADGNNDYFFLMQNKFYKLNTFQVFNRWGQLIFYTDDLNSKGWDGTLNGKPQPNEVYTYNIVATDFNGMIKTKKGNVTLLRNK